MAENSQRGIPECPIFLLLTLYLRCNRNGLNYLAPDKDGFNQTIAWKKLQVFSKACEKFLEVLRG